LGLGNTFDIGSQVATPERALEVGSAHTFTAALKLEKERAGGGERALRSEANLALMHRSVPRRSCYSCVPTTLAVLRTRAS